MDEITPNFKSLLFYIIVLLTAYAIFMNGAKGRFDPSVLVGVKVGTGLFTLVFETSRTIYKTENYIIKPYS